MSRSRRKTPKRGITGDTDKPFKTAEHRRARRKLRSLDLTEAEPPHAHAFGDPWNSQKDGKMRFDPAEEPGLLRK